MSRATTVMLYLDYLTNCHRLKIIPNRPTIYWGFAHELGFYLESVYRLIQVIEEEDPIATPKAIKVLVGHLPPEYEPRVAKTLLNLKIKH